MGRGGSKAVGRRLRTLVLLPSLEMGGSERVAVTVARRLSRDRFDVQLVTLKDTQSDTQIEIRPPPLCLGASRVRNALPRLLALVWRERPDIVLSTLPHLNGLLAFCRPLFPSATVFVARISSLPSKVSHNALSKGLQQLAGKRFDRLICQGERMKDDVLTHFRIPAEKISVIHNPVDNKEIEKQARESVEELPDYDVVSVGRLRPEKAMIRLIEVAKHLPNLRFAIVGDGPERAAIEAAIRQTKIGDRVRLLGYQKNPYPFLARARLVVVPSIFEGFPNVLLEAGVLGIPGLVFDAEGGAREIITEGLNGFFLGQSTPAAWAAGVQKALNHPFRAELIQETVNRRFGTKTIIGQYEDVLLTSAQQRNESTPRRRRRLSH